MSGKIEDVFFSSCRQAELFDGLVVENTTGLSACTLDPKYILINKINK